MCLHPRRRSSGVALWIWPIAVGSRSRRSRRISGSASRACVADTAGSGTPCNRKSLARELPDLGGVYAGPTDEAAAWTVVAVDMVRQPPVCVGACAFTPAPSKLQPVWRSTSVRSVFGGHAPASAAVCAPEGTATSKVAAEAAMHTAQAAPTLRWRIPQQRDHSSARDACASGRTPAATTAHVATFETNKPDPPRFTRTPYDAPSDTANFLDVARDQPARTAARWTARFVDSVLGPLDEPCPVLVGGYNGMVWALARSRGELALLPPFGQDGGTAREVIAGNGQFVFLERVEKITDADVAPGEARRSLGVYRLRLSDMTLQRAALHTRLGPYGHRYIGATPDARRAVVSSSWSVPYDLRSATTAAEQAALKYGAARVTLTVSDFDDDSMRELETVDGSVGIDYDDLPIQCSPDGKLVAVSLLHQGAFGRPWGREVRLYDLTRAQLHATIEGAALAGSLSWSADSSTLLLERRGRVVVHDLHTGEDAEIAALPGQRPEPPGGGRHRVLGFADEQALYTATQRGKSMTIWRIDMGTGDAEPLCQCKGMEFQYPVLGHVPEGYWT